MSTKISKYTFLLPQEDECAVLYNCRTEAIAVIKPEPANLIAAHAKDLDVIKDTNPQFYEFLVKKRFAVPQEMIEEDDVVREWEKQDNDPRIFNIFINPTLDCNLSCWYCFEKHVKGSLINNDVASAIEKLIERKITKDGLKLLSFSFFGGEPLIAFKSFISPILKKADKLCTEHHCLLNAGFVTNATLITDEMLDELQKLHVAYPIRFQITLDGNEQFHNLTKVFPNKKGSYDLVLKNIRKVLEHQMTVTLRLNMTNDNIESYFDVIDDISSLTPSEKSLITVDMQRVWQDWEKGGNKDFEKEQIKIRETFIQEGFNVNELKHIDNSRCYADKENHISINYDGRLFKCTARDFNAHNSEGMLLPDGSMKWNDKYTKRMQHRYGNDHCRKCRIFPLCHGGCSQHKLETLNIKGQCIRDYDSLFIQKIIEDRIEYLLEQINLTNKAYEEVQAQSSGQRP